MTSETPENKNKEPLKNDPDDGITKAMDLMEKSYPCIESTKTISEAYSIMKQDHLDSLPVKKNEKIVKVVTLNNLEIIRSPFFDAPGQEERQARLMCLSLETVNKKQKLISLDPNDSLKKVMQIFCKTNIKSAPVLNSNKEFLGMITTHAIFGFYTEV